MLINAQPPQLGTIVPLSAGSNCVFVSQPSTLRLAPHGEALGGPAASEMLTTYADVQSTVFWL